MCRPEPALYILSIKVSTRKDIGVLRLQLKKDSVAPNAVLGILNSDKLSQVIDGRFAGAVGDLRNIRHKTANRENVDNAAGLLYFAD